MILIDAYDDPTASYRVVAAPDGDAEVRSTFVELPTGWAVIHGSDDYQSCRDFLTAASEKGTMR